MDIIVLHISELPKYIKLLGDDDEMKLYKMMPAGRKFGAHLNAVDSNEEKLIKNTIKK